MTLLILTLESIVLIDQTIMASKIAVVAPIPVEKVKEIVIMTMNALAISYVERAE